MPNTFLQQGSLAVIGDPHPEWMSASVLPGEVYARENACLPPSWAGNSLVGVSTVSMLFCANSDGYTKNPKERA